ncbi:GAF domain-containing protein [Herbihabitans rhizosphaerae]|uniref:GAF domain-containing protein n=1 Tax=Herbihabitans rhizosphaerae TaxID=1872711 RepID=A0A4Q7KIP7_9PSEU|nr:GAF and ANTAR domain-containing protein [Herbihabitans rhizosphaerae]RZS36428.1 GAF domain-containing protein [Herbihabitans rhizosphaerae]
MLTVAHELAEITRLVEDDDFGTTLDRFVSRIADTVPGCDHAILTVRSDGAVETVAGAAGLDFDPIAPGPVVEAVTFGEPRRLDDVATDQRWPAFAAQVGNAGFRTCVALPLSIKGEDSAVLTLFSHKPDQFADTAYDVVLLLTLHAGVVFDNATLYHDSSQMVVQLRTALRTRSLVGRAQGMLMRHFEYSTDDAFATLKRASQNSNTKLRDLAAALVSAHEKGEFDTALQKLALTAAGEKAPD